MKDAHFIKVRVLSKLEDDETKIEEKLRGLLPFNLEEEKIKIKKRTSQGFQEKKIAIFEVELKKSSHTNKFIENLNNKLNDEQKSLLKKQVDSRIDEKNHFYIRLDKEKLLKNEYFITDDGNCFHIIICLACFPSTKDNAIHKVMQIFK